MKKEEAEKDEAIETVNLSDDAIAKLNPSQIRFICGYMLSGNASKSARDAGFHAQSGFDLLKQPIIHAEILRLKREIANKALNDGVLTKDKASLLLSDIARDEEASEQRDRINAVKELGNFHGWKAPKEVNHKVSGQVFGFLASIDTGNARQFDSPNPFIEQAPEHEKDDPNIRIA